MPPPMPESRPTIKASRAVSSHHSPEHNYGHSRPGAHRATTFEGPRQLHRDDSPPVPHQRMIRVPSDNVTMKTQRDRLRPLTTRGIENGDLSDPSDDSNLFESPDRPWKERSASPATSHGSAVSRTASYSTLDSVTNGNGKVDGYGKKAPPPPPPSRAKKPPPPPPPMKRSTLGTTPMSYA